MMMKVGWRELSARSLGELSPKGCSIKKSIQKSCPLPVTRQKTFGFPSRKASNPELSW